MHRHPILPDEERMRISDFKIDDRREFGLNTGLDDTDPPVTALTL